MHIEIIIKNYLGKYRCMFCFHVNLKLRICGLLHQETQRKHVSKSDFGLGKMENLVIFPDICYMIYRLHDSRVLPWCRFFK